jgi:hypothetical protein
MNDNAKQPEKPVRPIAPAPTSSRPPTPPAKEIGGRDGPEPTRYGDWEVNGICSDF